jgi:hypothetical protein
MLSEDDDVYLVDKKKTEGGGKSKYWVYPSSTQVVSSRGLL